MAIPKQVRAQGARADQIHKDLHEKARKPATTADPDADTPPTTTVPPTDPSPAGNTPEPNDSQKGDDAAYWRQRFAVMEGKYRAEVPRLRDKVNSLEEQLQASRNSEIRLKEQLQTPQEHSQPTTEHPLGLSQDEMDEFGDLLPLVQKAAHAAASAARSDSDRQWQERLDRLENTVQQGREAQVIDRETRYYADLVQLVPDWREIDASAAWHEWLNQVDDFSGEILDTLLKRAHADMDADRVSQFFNRFKGSQKGSQRQRPDPKEQVAPSSRGTGNQAMPQGAKHWTRTEISQFYADVQRGKYRGQEQRQREIEEDITAAMKEGRIQ